jgi:steroid delta-isomerase-like uncharacterized protein
VDHVTAVNRWVDCINTGNLEAVDDIFAPTFVCYTTDMPGPEGARAAVRMFRAAFPDLVVELEDVITDGTSVAFRTNIHGTHLGDLMGIPPTGKYMAIVAIDVFRGEDGKWVEGWDVFDRLGMMQQLGLIPTT